MMLVHPFPDCPGSVGFSVCEVPVSGASRALSEPPKVGLGRGWDCTPLS